MRLIDADRFKEYITVSEDVLSLFKTEEFKQLTVGAMEAILKDIDEQPTIDAVEVVRCKDCKYFDGECCDRYADETLGYSHSTQPNFFCACGERKTDG